MFYLLTLLAVLGVGDIDTEDEALFRGNAPPIDEVHLVAVPEDAPNLGSVEPVAVLVHVGGGRFALWPLSMLPADSNSKATATGPSVGATPLGGAGTGNYGMSNGPVAGISLSALFVNDDGNEVDSLDVVDGSLTGDDVSTSIGEVTHTGGNMGVGTTSPTADVHVRGNASVQLSGTVSTNGTTQVIGNQDTLFQDELAVGDAVSIDGQTAEVVTIDAQDLMFVDTSISPVADTAAFTDGDLLLVQNAAGTTKLSMDKQGRVSMRTIGITDGSGAAAGEVGEEITNSNTGATIGTSFTQLGSISLTPGDWDVRITAAYSGASNNRMSLAFGPVPASQSGTILGDTITLWPLNFSIGVGGGTIHTRKNITSNQTFYFNGSVDGTSAAGALSYSIRARRMR